MRYRNLALFVLLAVLWGSAFPAIKAGLDYFPPVLYAAFRYDLAGVFMLAYAVYATDRWRPRGRAEWWLVGVGAVFMIAGYHAFLFVGEQYTTAAAAAVVVGLSPVLTTGFARALLPSERLTPIGLFGLALGLGGVVIIAQPDPANLLGGSALGVLLVFCAIAAFSLGSVLARRSTARLPIETMEAWSMLGGALLMHAASAGLGESVSAVEWTPEAIAALAYLVGPASAVGFLIYFDLLERLGPVEINLVSYATPIVAAVVGWLLLGEVPGVPTAVGFCVILVGFYLLKREAIARELPGFRAALGGD